MKLSLLMYSHDWAPSVGGVQTVTMSLARGLAGWSKVRVDEEVEVTLVTQTPADGMDDSDLTFRVVRKPSGRELLKLVRSADVIHVANPAFVPLLLGWLFRKPTVLEHDGYQSICPNGLLVYEPDRSVCPGHFMARRYGKCVRCNSSSSGWVKSLRGLLLTFPRRWLARRVIRNVAPSGHIGRRVALPRTQIICHGVRNFPTSPAVAPAGHNRGLPCFAYIGRLVPEKGLPVLLRAASRLSQNGHSFFLLIVGDGTERSELEGLVAELGLRGRTEFTGAVSAEAVPALLAEVTAIVMPSICEDVAPLAASEMLIQGHLVIASDIGGLGEIVDGVGLKFPAGDAVALESCMRQVLENSELANELRLKARRRGEEIFGEKRMVEEHARLYQALVEH